MGCLDTTFLLISISFIKIKRFYIYEIRILKLSVIKFYRFLNPFLYMILVFPVFWDFFVFFWLFIEFFSFKSAFQMKCLFKLAFSHKFIASKHPYILHQKKLLKIIVSYNYNEALFLIL